MARKAPRVSQFPWSDRDIPPEWREILERPWTPEEVERGREATEWIRSHRFSIAPLTAADLLDKVRTPRLGNPAD